MNIMAGSYRLFYIVEDKLLITLCDAEPGFIDYMVNQCSGHLADPGPHKGAQWLSGRVLDSRPRDHQFEPHQHHCVVSLSKTHSSLLSTGSAREDPSRHN